MISPVFFIPANAYLCSEHIKIKMKAFNIIIAVTLLIKTALFCQLEFQGELGNFTSASSFSYNPAGFIYVTDVYNNELIKLDTLGNNVDDIGGYGWSGGLFDMPIDVFSTTLNVYVADKNNNRIQIFDKDLNFLTEFTNKDEQEESFGYPLSCSVSSTGDLFIVDGENKKVIKYDQNGRFLLQFGSYDAGTYSLNNPARLAVTSDNKIVILDDSDLIFFDQYGNGLTRITAAKNLNNVNITFNNMVLTSPEEIFYSDLKAGSPKIIQLVLPGSEWNNFLEGMIIGNNLYLLTPRNILLFKIKKG